MDLSGGRQAGGLCYGGKLITKLPFLVQIAYMCGFETKTPTVKQQSDMVLSIGRDAVDTASWSALMSTGNVVQSFAI